MYPHVDDQTQYFHHGLNSGSRVWRVSRLEQWELQDVLKVLLKRGLIGFVNFRVDLYIVIVIKLSRESYFNMIWLSSFIL